jgi:HAD superfamily hydrolase (TIGR01509 family)
MKTAVPFAVLFDMDGVLINTEPSHDVAHEFIRERYGFSKEEMKQAFGRGGTLRGSYEALQKLRPFGTSFDAFADEMLTEVFKHLETQVNEADPALVAFLKRLHRHLIPIAIGTSALRRSSAHKLAVIKLQDHFDVIVTSEDVTHAKPNPDVYLSAAQKLQMPASKCIVIDDTKKGVAAGKAAGMKVIGFSKYNANLDSFTEADTIASGFGELSHERLLGLITGKE